MVENHPQGKMVKDYQGENQGMFTQVISPTPDKITRLGIARHLPEHPTVLRPVRL